MHVVDTDRGLDTHSLVQVSERKITMAELEKAVNDGRVYEAFGAGTAAIISPINRIGYEGRDLPIPLVS